MDADVIEKDEGWIGVRVTDNNGANHKIAVGYDGTIQGHSQDGYADDPLQRTPQENEHVNQARRYAKYHVYRERGYDTLDRVDNPDCVLAAIIALARLSPGEFESHFGDLYHEVTRHFDDGPVTLPFRNADPDDIVVYRLDLYLEPDPLEFQEHVREAVLERAGGQDGALSGASVTSVIEELGEDDEIRAALDYELTAVSEVTTVYNDGRDNEQVDEGAAPLDREPDARVEPMPENVPDLEAFQSYLLDHLACQVRDCYVCMGVEPPMEFQRTGYGKYRCSLYQESVDLYEPYFDDGATITSWQPG